MAVLNTTSPTAKPGAPTEMPSKTVPSSRARMALSITGIALAGGSRPRAAADREPGKAGLEREGIQASGNFSRKGRKKKRPAQAGRFAALVSETQWPRDGRYEVTVSCALMRWSVVNEAMQASSP